MASRQTFDVTINAQGRLVVPAPLRRQLGIEAGDVLVARTDDDRLVLERRGALLARARDRFASIAPDVDLTAELVAERRAEALRER